MQQVQFLDQETKNQTIVEKQGIRNKIIIVQNNMSDPQLTTMSYPSYTNHISRSSAGDLQWLYCCNNGIMTN